MEIELKDKLVNLESLKEVYDNLNDKTTNLKQDLEETENRLSESITDI